MPLLVAPRFWGENILWRITPILAYFLVFALLIIFESMVIAEFLKGTDDEKLIIDSAVFSFFSLGILFLPAFLAMGLWRFGKKLSGRQGVLTVVLHALWLAMLIILLKNSLSDGLVFLATYFIALLLVWSGAGAILSWSLRTAIKQVRPLAAVTGRIVPVSMIIVLFGVLSSEFWQIADKISGSRILIFLGFMVLVALVTSFSVVYRELKEETQLLSKLRFNKSHWEITNKFYYLVRYANIYFVVIATQMIQSILFFILITFLLVIVFKLILSDGLIAQWIEHPVRYLSISQFNLPVSVNHIYTAALAAATTALNLVVSASLDKNFRVHLFDPVINNIRQCLKIK